MMKQQGFTLIELVVVIVILGVLAVIGLPKFLDTSTDAKLAMLKKIAGEAQTLTQQVEVMRHVAGATYEKDGQTYLRYNASTELLLNNDQLDIGEICKGIGLINTGLTLNQDAYSSDKRYRCKYENADKFFIQDMTLEKDFCMIDIKPNKHLKPATIAISCN